MAGLHERDKRFLFSLKRERIFLEKTAEQLRKLARPGDLILTVGAGDIYRAGEKILDKE